VYIVSKYKNEFALTVKQVIKGHYKARFFLPVSKARTNKFYIFPDNVRIL